jgi:vancomycin resistance protein YoaR
MSNKNQLLEKEDKTIQIENENTNTNKLEQNSKEENSISEFVPVKKKNMDVLSIFTLFVVIFIGILLVIFTIFTIYNVFNTNIISGIHIKGMDVSGLSASDAKYQLDNYLKTKLPQEITLKHGDFESTISISQMDISFDTKSAINSALHVGREGNIFQNNLQVLSMMFGNVNIEPKITCNKQLLTKNLEDLSSQLPDAVVQSSYYLENNELIVTSGKEGNIVDAEKTIENIKNSISTFSALNTPVEIAVKTEQPDEIKVEQIYNEIRKDPVDAYYTKDPFEIHPSENGIDFKISLEEAKAMISSEKKEEYSIPLTIIRPNVTTNMIGTEAFPDMLSTFSTRYAASNRNRTTNLMLAANKINGTVLMPGETFSYNKVVGARTIAAGYKEAPIYVEGRVEDGLGGGICQITSTLYNAVIYANLEITQRTNHQFVPSYVTASRDATVVYGALDFQFKNNRNYPIKLVCSVSGGIANFQIFGMRQEDDVEVQISSYETGRTATAIYSEAYKILKRNGQVVDKQLLSKDTYKRH